LAKAAWGLSSNAIDLRLKCKVAVKMMTANSEFGTKRFEREAELLANLQHANLPRVTDYFKEMINTFWSWNTFRGYDLQQIIDDRDVPFSFDEIDKWLYQLVNVLAFLHKREPPILHRDIKRQT